MEHFERGRLVHGQMYTFYEIFFLVINKRINNLICCLSSKSAENCFDITFWWSTRTCHFRVYFCSNLTWLTVLALLFILKFCSFSLRFVAYHLKMQVALTASELLSFTFPREMFVRTAQESKWMEITEIRIDFYYSNFLFSIGKFFWFPSERPMEKKTPKTIYSRIVFQFLSFSFVLVLQHR